MNNAFPKENLEDIDVFNFVEMEVLDELSLRENGVIRL